MFAVHTLPASAGEKRPLSQVTREAANLAASLAGATDERWRIAAFAPRPVPLSDAHGRRLRVLGVNLCGADGSLGEWGSKTISRKSRGPGDGKLDFGLSAIHDSAANSWSLDITGSFDLPVTMSYYDPIQEKSPAMEATAGMIGLPSSLKNFIAKGTTVPNLPGFTKFEAKFHGMLTDHSGLVFDGRVTIYHRK